MKRKSFFTNLLSPFLWLLSGFYFLGLQIDRAAKKSTQKKLPRPTISVGNVTFGGTGKTPLLIKLITDLKRMGMQPAVLTRGYQGWGQHSATEKSSNDETLLLEERCSPILVGVGRDRYSNGVTLVQCNNPTIFVLDDGFQHWKLARDLDIVCIDATDSLGMRGMFPFGRLREPISSLMRASLLVLTRAELLDAGALKNLKNELMSIAPSIPILISASEFFLTDSSGRPLSIQDNLSGKNIIAVSAIGNPDAYEQNLRTMGARVSAVRFSDHYLFQKGDLVQIEAKAHAEKRMVVITEKDWMKLRSTSWLSKPPEFGLAILKMNLVFNAQDEVFWQDYIRKYIIDQK